MLVTRDFKLKFVILYIEEADLDFLFSYLPFFFFFLI